MRRIMRGKGSAMPLAIGLAIGLVVAPVSAVAAVAASKVMITDGHDTAKVTTAGQVQAVTADVKSAKFKYAANITSSSCVKIFTAPVRSGFVVTQLRIDVWANPTPGAANFLAVFTSPTCGFGKTVVLDNANGFGVDEFSLDPGLGLGKGKSLYATASGSVSGDVMISGYVVAANAVPGAPPVTAARIILPVHAKANTH